MPTNQEKIEIIHCLKELDCCSRCILRYIGVKYSDTLAFEDPAYYLNFLFDDLRPDICVHLLVKKIRRNPCPACLGIFENSTMERFAECMPANIEDYKYSNYKIHVSFPKAVIIRNHSILIYLKEKFPHIYGNFNIEHISRIFRVASITIIAKRISKYFDPNSDFTLVLEIGYEDDQMEIQNIKRLKCVKTGKRQKQQDISRNLITATLEKCEDKVFKKHFPVPPEIPNKEPFASIKYKTEPLWLGGRYLKFSRNMTQMPLGNVDNQAVVQHSTQDILFDGIVKILGYSKEQLTFYPSGYEDRDVRILGNGRPFCIQVENVIDRCISFDQLRDIEEEIFKSKLAAVIKLQIVTKEDSKRIKAGEEYKNKHYNAFCKLQTLAVDDVTKKINRVIVPLDIYQNTPNRLNRRAQAIRKKYIYSMNAKTVPGLPNLFELSIVTEYGAYVKEFIHGDLGRTYPSITSIIGQPVEVVTLDVTAVEQIWPEIDN